MAIRLYQRILAIEEKQPKGLAAIARLCDLDMTLQSIDDHDAATASLQRRVTVLETHFGQRDPVTIKAVFNPPCLCAIMAMIGPQTLAGAFADERGNDPALAI